MSTHAVYPGSFDPFTLGHLDIVGRAAGLFETLTVMVVHNPNKTAQFSADERIELIKRSIYDAGLQSENIRFDTLEQGLLAERCRAIGANVIVKGVRNGSDLEYELPMAAVNRDLTAIETVFLPATPAVAHISSSLVKQVADLGGDVSKYLPEAVAKRIGEGK